MNTDFYDAILHGLDYSELEWLEIRIKRIKATMHSGIIARKTIIRKR